MKKTMITGIVLIAIVVIVIVVIVIVGYNIYRRPATFRHLTNKSLDEQQVNELKDTLLEKDDKKNSGSIFLIFGNYKKCCNCIE